MTAHWWNDCAADVDTFVIEPLHRTLADRCWRVHLHLLHIRIVGWCAVSDNVGLCQTRDITIATHKSCRTEIIARLGCVSPRCAVRHLLVIGWQAAEFAHACATAAAAQVSSLTLCPQQLISEQPSRFDVC